MQQVSTEINQKYTALKAAKKALKDIKSELDKQFDVFSISPDTDARRNTFKIERAKLIERYEKASDIYEQAYDTWYDSLSDELHDELAHIKQLKDEIGTLTDEVDKNVKEVENTQQLLSSPDAFGSFCTKESLLKMPKIQKMLNSPRYNDNLGWDEFCKMLAEDLKKHDELFDKKVKELTKAEKEEFTELHDLLFDKDGTSRARWAVQGRQKREEAEQQVEKLQKEQEKHTKEIVSLISELKQAKKEFKQKMTEPTSNGN